VKKTLVALVLFLLVLFVLGAILRAIPLHISDGFESGRLSRLRWSRSRFEPGAVVIQEQVVRAGRRALAITVHSGDRFEQGIDGSASTERAELMEAWWLFSRTGRLYVYSFSLYLPADFPVTSQRLVLAQWRQLCEAARCRPDRPILAIRYEDGRLQVTRQNQDEKVILYQGGEEVRGRWLDFRFVIRFDAGANGRIDATLNGAKIVSYRGPTVFQPAPGYPRHGLVYFKTGLYRDALQEPPWTIYVDEYRKDECVTAECP
jgi:hypothetical protein